MKALRALALSVSRIITPAFDHVVDVLEAREPDADVDVAGDLLIGEPEFVGGAPDVGAAASDRPCARRHGRAARRPPYYRCPGSPSLSASRDCARTTTGADGQRAHQSHGGQSSAPNQPFRQNASPGNVVARSRTQRASRQCWPNGRVRRSSHPTLTTQFVSSQADSAGKSAATWTDSRKIQHLPRFYPVELGLAVGPQRVSTRATNYTNGRWAQEIITTS